jgi:heptosyltransferase-2
LSALVPAGAPEPPRTLLILRFSAAGDILLTSPAVEAIARAWPETRILFATRHGMDGLVRHSPHVHEVVTLEKGEGALAFSRRLRVRGFDALLDLHDSPRSRALRLLLPRTRRAVWTRRAPLDGLLVRWMIKPWRSGVLLADRYHRAAEALVGRSLERGELRYWMGPDDQARAREALAAAGVDPDAPIVGVSPGAGWPTKRWPAERFAALARRILASGRQVVTSGSPDERPLCEVITRGAPGAVFVDARLDVWGGIISLCEAFVANDSGPMHMARGLQIPTLALFGSTDPDQFDFGGHAVLFNHQPCAPCHFYGRPRCPRGHFRCLTDIGEEEAWAALEGLLGGGARPAVHG